MTSTLVDSNVFLDLFGIGADHADWSATALRQAYEAGPIVLSPIVWAEICQSTRSEPRLESALNWLYPRRENLNFDMARRAGEAHVAYRRMGGARHRTLPDFLIGAQAELGGHALLTRDATRYRSYFPSISIIAPDTHP